MQPILQTLAVEKTDRANGARQSGTDAPSPKAGSFSKIVASQKSEKDRPDQAADESFNPAGLMLPTAPETVVSGKPEFPSEKVEIPFQETIKEKSNNLLPSKSELGKAIGSSPDGVVEQAEKGLAKAEPFDANLATAAKQTTLPGKGLSDAKAQSDGPLKIVPDVAGDEAKADVKTLTLPSETDDAVRVPEPASSLANSKDALTLTQRNDGLAFKQTKELMAASESQPSAVAGATGSEADKTSEQSASATSASKNDLSVAQGVEARRLASDRYEPKFEGSAAKEEYRSANGPGNSSRPDSATTGILLNSQNNGMPANALPSTIGAQVELAQTASTVGLEAGLSETDELLRTTTVDRVRTEPVAAKSIINQVVHSVSRGPGDGVIEVRLQPEELGRVRLAMTPSEVGMTIQISAERPETLELLRRNIEMLEANLREGGFSDLSFSFSQEGDESKNEFAAHEKPRSHDEELTSASLVVEEALRNQPLPTGRLDIRV